MGQTISFRTIWDNYPTSAPCVDTKTGQPPPGYENQCAIRVGYALEKSGVSFASFGGARCPASSRTSGLAAGAQELANWLKTRPFAGCSAVETFEGKTVFEKIEDRSGIIFLADYWQRSGETGGRRTGDHLDLWSGARMTSVSSWFRVHWGVSWAGVLPAFVLMGVVIGRSAWRGLRWRRILLGGVAGSTIAALLGWVLAPAIANLQSQASSNGAAVAYLAGLTLMTMAGGLIAARGSVGQP